MVNSFQLTVIVAKQDGGRWRSALLMILALAVVVSAAVAIAPSMHAATKHGADAEKARQCLDGSKWTVQFFNPSTNRFGVVCQVDGVWGIVILDKAKHEITAFVKNKMKNFQQVVKYMRNAGYEVVH